MRKLRTFLIPLSGRNHCVHRSPVAWIEWAVGAWPCHVEDAAPPVAHVVCLDLHVRQHVAILCQDLLLENVPRRTQLREFLVHFPEDVHLLQRFACPNEREGVAHAEGQDHILALHQHRRSQPHELRLPRVGGVACEGVVGQGHGGLAVHHLAEGVEVGVHEGILVLPGLLGDGLVGPTYTLEHPISF